MPASQKFAIVVTAVDQFSKVFQNLVKSVLSVKQPIAQTQAQLKALQPGAGGKKVNEQVSDLGDNLRDVSSVLGRLIPQLGGLGTVAGVVYAVKETVDYGAAIERTSRFLSISTSLQQEWEKKLQQSGATAGSASSGIDAFNTNLELADANAGDLQTLLKFLNIEIERTGDKSLDTAKNIENVHRAFDFLIRTQNPQRARQLLEDSGLGQDFAKFWLQTPEVQREQEAIARGQIASPRATARAERASQRLSAFIGAVQTGSLELFSRTAAIFEPDAWDNPFNMLAGRLRFAAGRRTAPAPGTPVAQAEGPIPGRIKTPAENLPEIEAELRRKYPQMFGAYVDPSIPELHQLNRVRVDININGAPANTTAATEQSGSNVEVTTQFGQFMPFLK